MIVCGYPAIGKSTVASNHGYVDLESSLYKGIENWHEVYVRVAKHISDQGLCVMLSTHKQVRDYMDSNKIEYTNIFPALEIKKEWIKKLSNRYLLTEKEKDKLALNRAKKYYDDDILDLKKHSNVLEIDNMNYELYDILFYLSYKKNRCVSKRSIILYDTKLICKELGYNFKYVVSNNRYKNVVQARVNVARRLFALGYVEKDIGYALGVNHSTVNYYRNKYVDLKD